MSLPPLKAGALQLMMADAFAAVAVTFVGASGVVAGVTEVDATEVSPVPMALVAVTVKV
jgi:hypothetical protein